jgi:hypothetical protein
VPPRGEFSKSPKDPGQLAPPRENGVGILDALRLEVERIRVPRVGFDAEECHDGVVSVAAALANIRGPSDLLGFSSALLSGGEETTRWNTWGLKS